MKYILIFLLTAILGFWGVIYWLDSQETRGQSAGSSENSSSSEGTPQITIVPTLQKGVETSDFALKAPSAAVTGKVTAVNGTVTIMRREAAEYVPLNENDDVFDGESIVTEDGTVAIEFPEVGTVTLDEETHVILANMIPANFLLEQVSGIVDVVSKVPVSIRVGALLVLLQGTENIDLQEDTITISLKQGTSSFGFVNADNETRVVFLEEGEVSTFTASTLEVETE